MAVGRFGAGATDRALARRFATGRDIVGAVPIRRFYADASMLDGG